MLKNIIRVTCAPIAIALCVFLTVAAGVFAEDSEVGDEKWTVEERDGRVFYFTRGTAVWGHEFGFFKDAGSRNFDIHWIAYSTLDKRVKKFIGKGVVISLDVDGRVFKLEAQMITAADLGLTQIMAFTNVMAEKALLDSLAKGRYVKVRIIGPKVLAEMMDIEEDSFSLKGFTQAREEAASR